MSRTIAAALDRAIEKLRNNEDGIGAQLAAIAGRDHVALSPVTGRSLALLNAPADLLDQAIDLTYPQVFIFGEQMENQHKEKFASFSGTLQLGIDVRISADVVDRIEADLHRYVEAVLNALGAAHSEWASGLMYGGYYSVSYSPLRLAGHNFLQSARISFALEQYVM
jgi:hypothetical protein